MQWQQIGRDASVSLSMTTYQDRLLACKASQICSAAQTRMLRHKRGPNEHKVLLTGCRLYQQPLYPSSQFLPVEFG